MAQATSDVERFWAKVAQSGECWVWTAATNKQGYGQFWDPARHTMGLAHRFSYEAFVGPLEHHRGIPGAIGQVVCHRCDNKRCVRPSHLFVGSQQDNMDDARRKGRMASRPGETNPKAKLTADQVAAIRASATGRYGERSAIARQWGISTGHVSKILKGDVWL